MKFKCLDKDGKFIGNVNGADAAEALANAQELSDNVDKVELIPGQDGTKKEKRLPKYGQKPIMSAQAVMASVAKKKKGSKGK